MILEFESRKESPINRKHLTLNSPFSFLVKERLKNVNVKTKS